jgi:hypothetical protein
VGCQGASARLETGDLAAILALLQKGTFLKQEFWNLILKINSPEFRRKITQEFLPKINSDLNFKPVSASISSSSEKGIS